MPLWNSLSLQDSATPLMAQLIYFHDHIMVILTLVMGVVSYWMASAMMNSLTSRHLTENQMVEILWTLFPILALVFIAFPSLHLLYLLDEINSPSLTLKVTGNQWFWSYEFPEFPSLDCDSFMVPPTDSPIASPRLLESDNCLILPAQAPLRLLVTASDVIHSWAVPSLGVKADAVPGRLNQISFKLDRLGLFYGQCSEICGAFHSFMPISLLSLPPVTFSATI